MGQPNGPLSFFTSVSRFAADVFQRFQAFASRDVLVAAVSVGSWGFRLPITTVAFVIFVVVGASRHPRLPQQCRLLQDYAHV